MLKYQIIPVTPFEQNCTLLWCDETNKAALVDPGGDFERIQQVLEATGVELEKVFVTHGHLDHAGAVAKCQSHYGVPVEGPHPEDDFWIQGMPQQSQMYGFPFADSFVPDRWLVDGDKVSVGNLEFDVVHCPGHTPGHVVFHQPENRLAWVGDVIFAGSIGRTDFPKGDHATLISSIKDKLLVLGDDIEFICGHGSNSTFGHERKTNPFVSGKYG